MREIAKVRVRYGYRKIRVLLNREAGTSVVTWPIGCTRKRVWPCVRSAAGGDELQCHAGSGFVAQSRTRFGDWISLPIS